MSRGKKKIYSKKTKKTSKYKASHIRKQNFDIISSLKVKIYCLENGIKPDDQIFKFKERGVQNKLKMVCDYLGYEYPRTVSGSFSLRRFTNNDYNVILVQRK